MQIIHFNQKKKKNHKATQIAPIITEFNHQTSNNLSPMTQWHQTWF